MQIANPIAIIKKKLRNVNRMLSFSLLSVVVVIWLINPSFNPITLTDLIRLVKLLKLPVSAMPFGPKNSETIRTEKIPNTNWTPTPNAFKETIFSKVWRFSIFKSKLFNNSCRIAGSNYISTNTFCDHGMIPNDRIFTNRDTF